MLKVMVSFKNGLCINKNINGTAEDFHDVIERYDDFSVLEADDCAFLLNMEEVCYIYIEEVENDE